MLHQLALTVEECNEGFDKFNFPQATTSLYNLWWYQICDVYLECLKPVFSTGTDEQKALSRNVLYTCLHTGLALISPFMPFLSEELYQRLPPRTANTPPSICVVPYPEFSEFKTFINEQADTDFQLAQKIAGEVRSAKAKYDIAYKTKIELTIQADNDSVMASIEKVSQEIGTLSMASSIKISKDKPEGSVPSPVGADCIAWLKLKGLVDLSKCKERIEKKKNDSESKIASLLSDMSKPMYEKVCK